MLNGVAQWESLCCSAVLKIHIFCIIAYKGHDGALVSSMSSQQEGSGFESWRPTSSWFSLSHSPETHRLGQLRDSILPVVVSKIF